MTLPRVAGKIAVITGAASGIGSASCFKLASEGAKVVLVDRVQKNLKSSFETLSRTHDNDHLQICGDVSQADFGKQVFDSVHKKYGTPGHVLVNCAGIDRASSFVDMTEEDFDEVIKVNLKSTFLMTKSFVSCLKEEEFAKRSIINVASIAGKSGLEGHSNYAASKAGVIGFTKTVGIELGRFGLRCNAVLPGMVKTPMLDALPQEVKDFVLGLVPSRRIGSPEEIANVCLFLASEESSYINCASIEVTGGFSA